jgi:homoserine dehydrogenase
VDASLAVLPRAAVRTRHYLRVPVHAARHVEDVGAWLAAQQMPVRQVALAQGADPQVLVLTDIADQAAVDLAVRALGAHPAVAGPVVALRVEDFE